MDKFGQSADAFASVAGLPLVEDVSEDLKHIVHLGLGARSISSHRNRLTAVFGLPGVPETTARGSDAGASHIVRLIRGTLGELRREDPDLADGLARLLGSTDASSTLSPVERRRAAAPILVGWNQPPESFLKRQQSKFCALLAERLISRAAEEAGLVDSGSLSIDPIVVPKGLTHATIEQQMYLRLDQDYFVRELEQVNTIRYEVDGPFDVKRQLTFYPVFEDPNVEPLLTGANITVDDGYAEGIHLNSRVPALPAGTVFTFGFRLTLRGGPHDNWTVISGRTMRAVSLMIAFELPPRRVWKIAGADTQLDLPQSMPDGADCVTRDETGLYIARFVAPPPRRHVGLGWE